MFVSLCWLFGQSLCSMSLSNGVLIIFFEPKTTLSPWVFHSVCVCVCFACQFDLSTHSLRIPIHPELYLPRNVSMTNRQSAQRRVFYKAFTHSRRSPSFRSIVVVILTFAAPILHFEGVGRCRHT